MEALVVSPDFTIKDIHKIREPIEKIIKYSRLPEKIIPELQKKQLRLV